jgi:hypothetical protein
LTKKVLEIFRAFLFTILILGGFQV